MHSGDLGWWGGPEPPPAGRNRNRGNRSIELYINIEQVLLRSTLVADHIIVAPHPRDRIVSRRHLVGRIDSVGGNPPGVTHAGDVTNLGCTGLSHGKHGDDEQHRGSA